MKYATDSAIARVSSRTSRVSRRGFLGASLASGALAAAGCSTGSSGSPSPAKSGSGGATLESLTWSFDQVATNLDPIKAGDLPSEAAISSSVQGLVVYNAAGIIEPYLAESWSHPDPVTWVFNIRPGVRFWDGALMTMEDVLYSINRLFHGNGTIFGGLFGTVTSVKQTGKMQLTIKLSAPNPEFLGLANFLFVGQKAYTEAHNSTLGSPGSLGMFTGPYVMEGYVPNESVTLSRFDGYWGQKGVAKKVTFQFIADDNTRKLALESGQLDGGFNVPPTDIASWRQISNIDVVVKPNLQIGYLSMDVKQSPWSDVHVRRAVAHCVDQAGIVKSILGGVPTAATSITPPGEWAPVGLSANEALSRYEKFQHYPFSIAMAKAELKQSAFPNGFTAKLPVPPTPAYLSPIALSIAQNLKQIGITLNIVNVQENEYEAGFFTSKNNTGIQILENGPTVDDPSDFPSIMLGQASIVDGGWNTANYVNPQVQKLIAQESAATKPSDRIEPIMEMLDIASQDVPYIMNYWNEGAMAISNKLKYPGFHAAWYCIQPWAALISPA
jgi:peptide/nickel transport system substrate-binding protein